MKQERIFIKRIPALKFSKQVDGVVCWFQTMGSIKKKDKFTGKIKSKPALVTRYKVKY